MLKRLGIITAVLNMFWNTAYAGTIWLPQASTISQRVDALDNFIWWLSVVSFTATMLVMVYFVWKYHRSKKGRDTAYILGNHTLEFTWTIIPLIFMLIVFAWGYRDYAFMRSEAVNPLEVNVVGRQWMWNFEYANGRKTMNELFIPINKPIKLILTSEDVIHDFSMPNMRLKVDVQPGMYAYISFTPILLGEHPIYCTMYCGTGHSDMLGKVWVLTPEDYQRWYDTGKVPEVVKAAQTAAAAAASSAPAGTPMSMAEKGQQVANSKGCVACHTADGTKKIGPSWKGIWGRDEELEGGKSVRVDENYVRESIMDPTAKIVKGFPPTMPPFKGLVTDEEVNALIAYIKSLK